MFLVNLHMLLQLDNSNKNEIKKLLAFAQQNNLQLSLVDESEENFILPGKPLTSKQLNQLIENSRKSGVISMSDAHGQIRSNYNGG